MELFKLSFICLFFSINCYSQYKSVEKLTEADASDYLKIEGFRYDIQRSEDSSGLITWSANNGSTSNKIFMSYTFWPFNLGIQQRSRRKILTYVPNINTWIRNLPSNLKNIERSLNQIYASDDSDPSKTTKVKSLVRAKEPYYRDNRGKGYYFWIESEVDFFKKQIEIDEIGFKYGVNNQETYSFLREDTYDLSEMVTTFFLDFQSYLLRKTQHYYANGDKELVKLFTNSQINTDQPVNAVFKTLKNETIAIAIGMNDDSKVDLVVNPSNWKNYSNAKRLYIIYHELGHDIFNLNHGNGGKMMFNYAEKEVTWKDFIEDRIDMFEKYILLNQNKLIQSSRTNKAYKPIESSKQVISNTSNSVATRYLSSSYSKGTEVFNSKVKLAVGKSKLWFTDYQLDEKLPFGSILEGRAFFFDEFDNVIKSYNVFWNPIKTQIHFYEGEKEILFSEVNTLLKEAEILSFDFDYDEYDFLDFK